MQIILLAIQIIFVPLISPLGIGIINKLKSKLTRKKGAGVLQPYRDIYKLFHKDEVISNDASAIFRLAPYIIFSVSLVVAASIPLFVTSLHGPLSDIITVAYLLALGTFFLALAGMDTGSAFGGFGSSREMTMAVLAEASFIFSLLVLVVLSGTTDLGSIAQAISSHYQLYFIPALLAFVGFIITLLAETSRFPFDNPDTHLELTMIHEAMLLEYSGKKLALMEWASANRLFIFSSLAVNLFFPMSLSQVSTVHTAATGLGLLLLKLFVLYSGIALLEASIAKFRFFRLPDLLFTAFVLNVVAIGMTTVIL